MTSIRSYVGTSVGVFDIKYLEEQIFDLLSNGAYRLCHSKWKKCQQIFRFYLSLSFEPIKTQLPCEKVYSYLNIYHTFKSIELEPWVLHLVPMTTGFLKIDRWNKSHKIFDI